MRCASNLACVYDERFKTLVTTAATEPDAAKRKALYSQINGFLLDAAYVQVINAYSNIMAMGECPRSALRAKQFVSVRETSLA